MSGMSQYNCAEGKATRREWIALVAISLPCLLCAMDLTVLHLVVPRISTELRPTGTQLLWIVDIYGFVLAGLLITMGSLADRIGCRRLLLVGAAAFGAASVFASLADNPARLIAARALLGAAGATLAPSTLALIRQIFLDRRQRAIAVSVWAASFSLGGAIGPLIGGVLLQHFDWGAVFLIAVPIMVLVLALGPLLLPEFVNSSAMRMDLIGAMQSIAAVLLIVFGFKLLVTEGWGWSATGAISLGLTAGVLFIRRQHRLQHPLIDLGLVRQTSFAVLLLAYSLGSFVTSGISLLSAQYLQLVLGLSPLEAGLWTLPRVAGFVLGSFVVSVAVRHFRQQQLLGAGLMIAVLGLTLLTQMQQRSGVELLASSLFVLSFGFAVAFIPAIGLMVGSAGPERAGQASALSETGAELGGALGVAILGALGIAVYERTFTAKVPLALTSEQVSGASETLGGALAIAKNLPADVADAVVAAACAAFDASLHWVAMFAVLIILALATMVLRSATARAADKPTTSASDASG